MASPATATKPATNGQAVASQPGERVIEYKPFLSDEPIKLSVAMVLKFHCRKTKSGQLCSEEQAMRFVMLCMARQLNPWEGDAFLVGYDTKDGPEFNLVTAHQAFLKRAEVHPHYNGMASGVIVNRDGVILELDGDFYIGNDILVGGWAKVFRRDRDHVIYRRLKLATFQKPFGRWQSDAAGMIVKCAEADALRSSFPNVMGGMYLREEMDDDTAAVSTRQQRVASIKAPQTEAIGNSNGQTPVNRIQLQEKPEAVYVDGEVESDSASENAGTAEEDKKLDGLSNLELHCIAIREAETPEDVEANYQAAFADPALSKSDKAKIGNVRDERLKALKG